MDCDSTLLNIRINDLIKDLVELQKNDIFDFRNFVEKLSLNKIYATGNIEIEKPHALTNKDFAALSV